MLKAMKLESLVPLAPRVFDLFDRNGDGEITVDELAQALDALGLDADHAGLAATVGAYVQDGAAGLRFEDFDKLHRALGDAFFGAIVDQQAAAAAGADGGKGGEGGRAGDAGGVQGLRRRRRRLHLRRRAAGGAQEAGTPRGQQHGLGGRRSPAKSNLDARMDNHVGSKIKTEGYGLGMCH